MSIVMLCIACGTRTPILLWVIAFGCDTVLLMTFMLLRAFGKL